MKLNYKAFTLIELLAVIVILAIIALIATPIVLNIIKETRESSQLRSAEMYLDAVEYGIADMILNNKTITDGKYTIMENGNICIGTLEENTCTGEILEVKVNGETPSVGSTISFKDRQIESINLVYGDKVVVKDTTGSLVYQKTFEEICKYANNGVEEKTAGAKYTCEVKPGTNYTFYVLTTPEEGSETINLIMERNICENGTVTTAENTCLVAWQSTETPSDGPVTAMDYLYKATSTWSNIPNIEMNYTDEGNTGDNGYGTIVTTNNITKITKKDGTAVTVLTDQEGYINLKARLPYKSEVSNYDSTNKTNAYLYDYLNLSGTIQTNAISGIYGYWTLSSDAVISGAAWYVHYDGYIGHIRSVGNDFDFGVRPVITLKL